MNSPVIPELLLPAGGFDSALAGIEGGADALYLGFSDFSARKQAKNFDRLEYRRLYRLARDRGVRIYAAINTVILQDELELAAGLLAFLGRFPPDAVLVQDWGLARIIRDRQPGIAIHASTQAAVQGIEGLRIARELGASRVVLPRETSLAEIRRLHTQAPDIELEAFVHGALCYSFSGLCLASGLVLKRSGNRGECAQLCRSYYDAQSGGLAGRRGYWFSCRDLDLGDRLGELAEAGVSSLKVEGRMKSPEYCFAVASLYRGFLDRLAAAKGPGDDTKKGAAKTPPDDAEIAARREEARIAFARSPTEGWIEERGGASLIDATFPGHRGAPVGRIVSNDGGRLVIDLQSDLGLRDGLLGFDRGDQSRPLRFAVLELKDYRTGRDIVRARALSRVEILAMAEGEACSGLRAGDQLSRISARKLDRRSPSPEEYEPEREVLRLSLGFGPSGTKALLGLPRFDGRRGGEGEPPSVPIEGAEELPLDKARAPGSLERALSLFDESGDADFRLAPEIDREELRELFIPPSVLKREKNRIYASAAGLVAAAELDYARSSLAQRGERRAGGLGAEGEGLGRSGEGVSAAPPRSALVFPREALPSGLPFAFPRDLKEGAALPQWGGRSWLPLAPLVADRDDYARRVEDLVGARLESGGEIALGLGALHHIALARALRSRQGGAAGRLSFFLDFSLYVANDFSLDSLSSLVPGVEFAYGYIEREEGSSPRLAPIGSGFEPPLFQSLGCFIKQHIAGGACPDGCGRSWSGLIADRDRRYTVLVEDCVTLLFRAGNERNLSP